MNDLPGSSSIEKRERDREPHPIWRGIGLLMMVFIPLLSFVVADLVIDIAKARGVSVPQELSTISINIPGYGRVDDLLAVIIFALALTLLLFGIFTIINAAAYGASGDKTYRKFESEPEHYKRKRKLKKPKYTESRKRKF